MALREPRLTLPDLTGTRVVLTGGSDGMGAVMAHRLAASGADLVLPVRNRRKGEAVIAAITAETPSATVSLRDLDLSSLEQVTALGETLRAEGDPIHRLILNAGVMTPPDRQTTADGHELQWGANHLANVALVGHLLPLLVAGAGRVTSQVSVAARSGEINWDDLDWEQSYDGMRAYRQSKIALGLFGLELQRRSEAGGWGITSNLAHPGVAPTNLLAARPEVGRERDTITRRLITLASRVGLVGTVESAGLPALLAATSPDAEPGGFYGPTGPGGVGGAPGAVSLYKPLRSAEDAARVWEVSQRLVGVDLDPGTGSASDT